jgi:hypothetical protein
MSPHYEIQTRVVGRDYLLCRIENAIRTSTSHDEIVHIECTSEELAYLKKMSEDYVTLNDGAIDAWGTYDDGTEWRVRARVDPCDVLTAHMQDSGEYD